MMLRGVSDLILVDFADDGSNLAHVGFPWNGCGHGEGGDNEADKDYKRPVHHLVLPSATGVIFTAAVIYLGEEVVT
jgi:hypothetical protein